MAVLNTEGLKYFYEKLLTKIPGLDSIISITQGGTGATTAGEARVNLGICSSSTDIIYNSSNFVASTTTPSSPTEGMIWLVIEE